ncbi:MAG: hypothetical protein Q8K36_05910, partial [Alphaproteobacteria bacterium]|nr:hypothetical protein [Alphaproteobacteria bacterium]
MIIIPYPVLTALKIIDSENTTNTDHNLAKAYLKTLLASLSDSKKRNLSMRVRQFPTTVKLQNMPQMIAINEYLHGTTKDEYHENRQHIIAASQQLTLDVRDAKNYLIPPIIHRVWLTDHDDPQEVPLDKLENYSHSVHQFSDTEFRHIFWCFNPDDIPETIRILRTFSPSVEIHTIDEVVSKFICAPLINKLLRDKLFGFASNIIRKEILYQWGGIYNDIGLRQEIDISKLLKCSKHIFYLNESGYIDVCVMG